MQQDKSSTNNMNMQLHDTFWRDDQVMVIFHSKLPLIENGVLSKEQVLNDLNLREQMKRINTYLFQKFREQGLNPIHLVFLGDNQKPAISDRPLMRRFDVRTNSPLHAGVYLFDQGTDIERSFGTFRTTIHAFVKIVKGPSPDISDVSAEMIETRNHDDDDHYDKALVPTIVKFLNNAIIELNYRKEEMVPLVLSAPTWLIGATQVGIGCPLTPPMPVKDTCPNWHIELLDVDPKLPATGDGVTVFVLDSFPERGIISRAARDAGRANWLLHTVNETVSFDYSLMSGVQEIDLMDHTNVATVGKDVYGEHYPMLISDHGLFIAGIVRDIAPGADIECIRVLHKHCVGDLEKVTHALERIYNRMIDRDRDLFEQNVVINMSLVLPRVEDVELVFPGQIKLETDDFEIIPADLLFAIRALQQAGAVIVASAGNEGDERVMPDGTRPAAFYPAALGKQLKNVIAVGAASVNDDATSYSCYPGSYPDDNRAFGLATWGGEVPDADKGEVVPPKPGDPGSDKPKVKIRDAPRGIYSSTEFPPLSAVPADPPEQYYTARYENAWAYWIGTSFASPIVSAVVARILELYPSDARDRTIYNRLVSLLSGRTVIWNKLPSEYFPDGNAEGPLLKVKQKCSYL